MKPEIHPESHDATITCACGNVIETRSTAGSYNIEICSACHPFFTGKAKLIDTQGRVERFNQKYKRFRPEQREPEPAAVQAEQQPEG